MALDTVNLAFGPTARVHYRDNIALSAEYTSLAFVSVAVWDALLCGRIEYLTIWRGRPSVLKSLYLATRYFGLITASLLVGSFTARAESSSRTCYALVEATMSFVTIACFVRLVLRSYRIASIYRFNRTILAIVVVGSLATVTIQSYLVSAWKPLAFPLSTRATGCYPVPDPEMRWVGPVYWAPLVIDSSLLLALITSRTIARFKASGESASFFFKLCWIDGARFQVVLFAINTTILCLSLLANPLPGLLFLPFAAIGSTTLLCRLVHSLYRAERHSAGSPPAAGLRANSRPGGEPIYLCGEFGSMHSVGDGRQLLPEGTEQGDIEEQLSLGTSRRLYGAAASK